MWYLVAPPIIVVLSLFFLLWYLSRKGVDPVVAKRVLERGEAAAVISFPRTKEFFLKLLEKGGQRFKIMTLRMHNTFNDFTQSVKASRVKVHSALSANKVSEGKDVTDEDAAPIQFFDESKKEGPESILVASIVRKDRRESSVIKEQAVEIIPRPMVSEVAVHPEKRKRPLRQNTLREEDLIARIARDPKDFTAYEELGDYYLDTNSIKDAKECYRQVLKLSPVHRMVKIKIRRLERLLTKSGE